MLGCDFFTKVNLVPLCLDRYRPNLLLAVIAIAQVNQVNPCAQITRLCILFLQRLCQSHATFEWNLSLCLVKFALSMLNLSLEITLIHRYETRVT